MYLSTAVVSTFSGSVATCKSGLKLTDKLSNGELQATNDALKHAEIAYVLALAIEMGADAMDISKTIHPHRTLGESIGMAAEVAHGSCMDLPPVRK